MAVLAVLFACAVAAANVARFSASTNFADLVYGEGRSPLVALLLGMQGPARTAVVVYLAEQAWAAILAVSAATPLFVWLLGATAVHAAASLAEARRGFRRFFVFSGYATAVALIPAGLLGWLLGGDARSPAAAVGRASGPLLLVWLGFLFFRGIEAYYQVRSLRAGTILVVAVALFYVAPLVLIAVALVAIVIAAVVLELA